MAKHRIEDTLAGIHALRTAPPSPEVTAELRKALASPTNLIVAKAADVAAHLRLGDLGDAIAAGFDRFMVDPASRDKGCMAKTAIVKALLALDHAAQEIYLRGARHTQPEPSYGGSSDTAAELRSLCAIGLVNTRTRNAMPVLVDLLMDPEQQVRSAAARALGGADPQSAPLLLRLKCLAGDREPDVLAECFASLVGIDPLPSIQFIARFLNDRDPGIADAAALGIGACRRPEAFAILKSYRQGRRGGASDRAVFVAMATTRQTEAVDFLIDIVRKELRSTAVAAVEALAMYRHDATAWAKVMAAVEQRGDATLIGAIE